MNIYEAINTRRSVRSYKPNPISPITPRRLLEAATRAPSWANKQCWRFIVVNDPELRALIGKQTAMHHMAKALRDAPYTIVLCADPRASRVVNGIELFVFDCAAAMQNLILAATAEGLGTCIISAFHEEPIRALLGVPQDIRIVALTPLGYPSDTALPTVRESFSKLVCLNRWG